MQSGGCADLLDAFIRHSPRRPRSLCSTPFSSQTQVSFLVYRDRFADRRFRTSFLTAVACHRSPSTSSVREVRRCAFPSRSVRFTVTDERQDASCRSPSSLTTTVYLCLNGFSARFTSAASPTSAYVRRRSSSTPVFDRCQLSCRPADYKPGRCVAAPSSFLRSSHILPRWCYCSPSSKVM